MDLREIVCGYGRWMDLVRDRAQWRCFDVSCVQTSDCPARVTDATSPCTECTPKSNLLNCNVYIINFAAFMAELCLTRKWSCSHSPMWPTSHTKAKFHSEVYSRNNSVSIVTRLWAGRAGFDSRKGQDFFATTHRLTLRPTQLPIRWYWGLFSWG
jgi:hypothetical protein